LGSERENLRLQVGAVHLYLQTFFVKKAKKYPPGQLVNVLTHVYNQLCQLAKKDVRDS